MADPQDDVPAELFARLAADPLAAHLGITLDEVRPGYARASMTVGPHAPQRRRHRARRRHDGPARRRPRGGRATATARSPSPRTCTPSSSRPAAPATGWWPKGSRCTAAAAPPSTGSRPARRTAGWSPPRWPGSSAPTVPVEVPADRFPPVDAAGRGRRARAARRLARRRAGRRRTTGHRLGRRPGGPRRGAPREAFASRQDVDRRRRPRRPAARDDDRARRADGRTRTRRSPTSARSRRPVAGGRSAAACGGRFVGGHPMCGTERSGHTAVDPGLFTGARWALCLEPATELPRWLRVAEVALAVGAEVVPVTAARARRRRRGDQPRAAPARRRARRGRRRRRPAGAGAGRRQLRDGTRVIGSDPAFVTAMVEGERRRRPPRRSPACSAHLEQPVAGAGRGAGTPSSRGSPAGATSGCRWSARRCWPLGRAGGAVTRRLRVVRGGLGAGGGDRCFDVGAGQSSAMDEKDILSRIHALVDEEHQLRESSDHTDQQRARIGELEAASGPVLGPAAAAAGQAAVRRGPGRGRAAPRAAGGELPAVAPPLDRLYPGGAGSGEPHHPRSRARERAWAATPIPPPPRPPAPHPS